MSWQRTYTHTLALSVDLLLCSWLWNRTDVTISSLCWLRMQGQPNRRWRALAWFLEHIDRGHLEGARAADIARARAAISLLGG